MRSYRVRGYVLSGLIVVSVCPAHGDASSLPAYTSTERFVLDQVGAGQTADLSTRSDRRVGGPFLAALITGTLISIPPYGIRITQAIVEDTLNLENKMEKALYGAANKRRRPISLRKEDSYAFAPDAHEYGVGQNNNRPAQDTPFHRDVGQGLKDIAKGNQKRPGPANIGQNQANGSYQAGKFPKLGFKIFYERQ